MKLNLKKDFIALDKCFYETVLVLNLEKCCFMTHEKNSSALNVKRINTIIKNDTVEKLLGFHIYSHFNFKSQAKSSNDVNL